MKRILAAAVASVSIAGSAQAATLTVELWDILAGQSTCCAANPSIADQEAARTVDTGDTVLVNLPSPLNTATNYLPNIDAIIAGEGPHATFEITGAALVNGFSANGITGLSDLNDTSINDFFGVTVGDPVTGIGNNSILGTILRITGYVNMASGQMFETFSDDGYRIEIGDGSPIFSGTGGAPLQAPVTRSHTYDGTAGLQKFTMVWFDNQRTEAALEVDGLKFVAPVPLPAGMALMLAGLAAFGVAGRMRRRA